MTCGEEATRASYQKGCRCGGCTTKNREYAREAYRRNARRRNAGVTKERIVRLLKSGFTLAQIAEFTRVSRSTLYLIVKTGKQMVNASTERKVEGYVNGR